MITIDLFLEVPLSLRQMAQSFVHACHLLLSLETFSVLTTHIAGDRVQNTLEIVVTIDLIFYFQLQNTGDRKRFDRSEFQPERGRQISMECGRIGPYLRPNIFKPVC